jgi:hypothetical protein
MKRRGELVDRWRRVCPQTSNQYRIAVNSRVERTIARTRKSRQEDELVMEGGISCEKVQFS